jgi:hypothetical protein
MLKLFSLKSLAVLAAMLTLGVGASGCDWSSTRLRRTALATAAE